MSSIELHVTTPCYVLIDSVNVPHGLVRSFCTCSSKHNLRASPTKDFYFWDFRQKIFARNTNAENVLYVIRTSLSSYPRIFLEQTMNSKRNLNHYKLKTVRDVRKIIVNSKLGTRLNLIRG